MRHYRDDEIVLTLKDSPGSPNAPGFNASPEENAAWVDATVASLMALSPTARAHQFADLVRRLMGGGASQPDGKGWQSPAEAHARRVQADSDRYHDTRALQGVLARMQAPLATKVGVWGGWN